MAKQLDGKVALVMGAGSSGPGWGNGKATAVAFAKAGAKVFAMDRDAAALEDTRAHIASEGGECAGMVADIAVSDQVAATVARCMETFGRIDILHNNVGIVAPGSVTRVKEADWEKLFAVNARGMMLSCRHAIPHMVEQGGGTIINISTIAAVRYLGFAYSAYDASKAAVNAMTRGIAADFGPKGIRANVILIGLMDTPLARGGIEAAGRTVDEIYANYVKSVPLRRMGTAHDVAKLAVFLASDDAAYITGAEIPVDGGLIARCM